MRGMDTTGCIALASLMPSLASVVMGRPPHNLLPQPTSLIGREKGSMGLSVPLTAQDNRLVMHPTLHLSSSPYRAIGKAIKAFARCVPEMAGLKSKHARRCLDVRSGQAEQRPE